MSLAAKLNKNTLGTNALLRSMIDCTDVDYLASLEQDPNVPRQVQKRARFKLALIWQQKEKRFAAVKKAQETRKKNKAKASETPAKPTTAELFAKHAADPSNVGQWRFHSIAGK